MKKFLMPLTIALATITLFASCAKKPLTLDENTSMKTLIKASDKEITDLIFKEVAEKANMSQEDVSVEYILRDDDGKAIAVKLKSNKE